MNPVRIISIRPLSLPLSNSRPAFDVAFSPPPTKRLKLAARVVVVQSHSDRDSGAAWRIPVSSDLHVLALAHRPCPTHGDHSRTHPSRLPRPRLASTSGARAG